MDASGGFTDCEPIVFGYSTEKDSDDNYICDAFDRVQVDNFCMCETYAMTQVNSKNPMTITWNSNTNQCEAIDSNNVKSIVCVGPRSMPTQGVTSNIMSSSNYSGAQSVQSTAYSIADAHPNSNAIAINDINMGTQGVTGMVMQPPNSLKPEDMF